VGRLGVKGVAVMRHSVMTALLVLPLIVSAAPAGAQDFFGLFRLFSQPVPVPTISLMTTARCPSSSGPLSVADLSPSKRMKLWEKRHRFRKPQARS